MTRSDQPPSLVRRVLDWLRAGYPDGIPAKDYQPVVALLRREQVESDVIARVVEQLLTDWHAGPGDDPITSVDAGVALLKHTNELPSEADIDRVQEHLAQHGWPFDRHTP